MCGLCSSVHIAACTCSSEICAASDPNQDPYDNANKQWEPRLNKPRLINRPGVPFRRESLIFGEQPGVDISFETSKVIAKDSALCLLLSKHTIRLPDARGSCQQWLKWHPNHGRPC